MNIRELSEILNKIEDKEKYIELLIEQTEKVEQLEKENQELYKRLLKYEWRT